MKNIWGISLENSFELLKFLKNDGYLKNPPHQLWWPNAGSFEVVIESILGQNTRWEQVFMAIEKLRKDSLLSLDAIANIDDQTLQKYISNVGFYRQKSARIIVLCRNILCNFDNFDNFCLKVTREWLLSQKGIGFETADSILCYAALRDEMVADNYTYKLLRFYGYDIHDYDSIKEWLVDGLSNKQDSIFELYGREINTNELYARFHGKIVEYCKNNKGVLCQK